MTLRTERVSSVLKEEVGAYLSKEFRDSSTGLLTVTDVIVTPDLKIAKIYVSILGSDVLKERTMKALEEQKAGLRSFIGSHLRLKFTPSISFYVDDSLDRVERIDRLLKRIHDEEQKKSTRDTSGQQGPS